MRAEVLDLSEKSANDAPDDPQAASSVPVSRGRVRAKLGPDAVPRENFAQASSRNPTEHLTGIGIFVRVAESRSFHGAANRLGMSLSGVSKAIKRLETRLGVRLVNRTTRSVGLTLEGEVYLKYALRLLNDLDDARDAMFQACTLPSGRLRLKVPRALGRQVIVPALPRLLETYPDLSLDVLLDGRNLDLAEEGIDIALRYGAPPDSRCVARRLCRVSVVMCASPGYIERYGSPRSIDELMQHRCIDYVSPQTGRYRMWDLTADGHTRTLHIPGKINFNDVSTMRDACLEGAGIAYLPDFLAADAVSDGRLSIVLPQYLHEGPSLHMVYHQSRYVSTRMRAGLDFLIDLLPSDPSWRQVVLRRVAELRDRG